MAMKNFFFERKQKYVTDVFLLSLLSLPGFPILPATPGGLSDSRHGEA